MQTPDMDDVKESVRQGVTKVAGRLSNLASGAMSQLQVRNHWKVIKMLYFKTIFLLLCNRHVTMPLKIQIERWNTIIVCDIHGWGSWSIFAQCLKKTKKLKVSFKKTKKCYQLY